MLPMPFGVSCCTSGLRTLGDLGQATHDTYLAFFKPSVALLCILRRRSEDLVLYQNGRCLQWRDRERKVCPKGWSMNVVWLKLRLTNYSGVQYSPGFKMLKEYTKRMHSVKRDRISIVPSLVSKRLHGHGPPQT